MHVDSSRIVFEHRLRKCAINEWLTCLGRNERQVDIIISRTGEVYATDSISVGKAFGKINALDIGRDCREEHGEMHHARVGDGDMLVCGNTLDAGHAVFLTIGNDI